MIFILLALPLLPGGVVVLAQGGDVIVAICALWQWLMLTSVGVMRIRG